MQEDANSERELLGKDRGLAEEWLRQNNLMYGGLIGIGVILVQPHVTTGALGPVALVSVLAFSVAVPLLAALMLLNRQEVFKKRASSQIVGAGRGVALLLAITGIVAAFWQISWLAGIGVLVCGGAAIAVHGAGSPPHPRAVQAALSGHQRSKLERDGDTLFVVPRPARDLDDVEQVEFGELM